MKKTILLIAMYLSTNIAKADEVPWVLKILSKDSTVWILVSRNATPDSVLYKIDFDNSGKIYWGEDKEHALYNTQL